MKRREFITLLGGRQNPILFHCSTKFSARPRNDSSAHDLSIG
jgi:hypothetical protein